MVPGWLGDRPLREGSILLSFPGSCVKKAGAISERTIVPVVGPAFGSGNVVVLVAAVPL
jgi:hypothetical protein